MDMLRASDAAAILGLTTGRAYQLIAEGVIPAERYGHAIRIPRAGWDRFLSEWCQPVTPMRRRRA
ncbi:MAG: excisionase family DNA-binding protein [Anaerolineae bacterium]|nr:excisionase family DNA-binding protein [Anaerolineae bacterium]NIN98472.1 excisionase family DNA-binding protein [Anaerolineae bacterium]NIQ81369.1 excisionase family DNA-binding protein [Anaerolineae bacterium]